MVIGVVAGATGYVLLPVLRSSAAEIWKKRNLPTGPEAGTKGQVSVPVFIVMLKEPVGLPDGPNAAAVLLHRSCMPEALNMLVSEI
jgi:hypothetical protein